MSQMQKSPHDVGEKQGKPQLKQSLGSTSTSVKSVIILTKQKDTSQAIFHGRAEAIALQ